MPLEIAGDGGRLIITEEAVAGLAGAALLELPGLGRRPSRRVKDGLRDLLGGENLARGIQAVIRSGAVELEITVAGADRERASVDEIIRRAREAVEEGLGVSVRAVRVVENRPRGRR